MCRREGVQVQVWILEVAVDIGYDLAVQVVFARRAQIATLKLESEGRKVKQRLTELLSHYRTLHRKIDRDLPPTGVPTELRKSEVARLIDLRGG